MSKRTLTNLITKHQVYLERLKSQMVLDFDSVIQEVDARIAQVLGALENNQLSRLTQGQLNSLLRELRDQQLGLHTKAMNQLTDQLVDVAGEESKQEHTTLSALMRAKGTRRSPAKVSSSDAYARALAQPLGEAGVLLEPFVKNWSTAQVTRVNGLVRKAWAEGVTVDDLKRQVLGTTSKGKRDGATRKARREAAAMVRTAVQHVSSQSRMATWEANEDLVKEYTWTATLDGRTTPVCQGLDGKSFPVGKGPLPPAHVGCRSSIRPKLGAEFDFLDEGATRSAENGPVDADTTYYSWLKNQDPDFVKDAIGADRAKLLLGGQMTVKEFEDLALGKNFEPLTLKDMAAKRPDVFKGGGLEKYLPTEGVAFSAPETSLEKARRILREKREAEKLAKQSGGSKPAPAKTETSLEKARRILQEKRAAAKLAGLEPAVQKPAVQKPAAVKKPAPAVKKSEELMKQIKDLMAAKDPVDTPQVPAGMPESLAKLMIDYSKATDRLTQDYIQHKYQTAYQTELAAAAKAANASGITPEERAKRREQYFKLMSYNTIQQISVKSGSADVRAKMKELIFTKTHNAKLPGMVADAASTPAMKSNLADAHKILEGLFSERLVTQFQARPWYLDKMITLPADGRPYYNVATGGIYMTSKYEISAYLHEMTHALEYIDRDISAKAKAFVEQRGKRNGGTLRKLRDITGNKGFSDDEVAYEDEWAKRGGHAYVGKVYKNSPATELITMGVERLWQDPHKFFLDDPEYFEFIIAALKD